MSWQERLWRLHTCKHSRPDWTQIWAVFFNSPYSEPFNLCLWNIWALSRVVLTALELYNFWIPQTRSSARFFGVKETPKGSWIQLDITPICLVGHHSYWNCCCSFKLSSADSPLVTTSGSKHFSFNAKRNAYTCKDSISLAALKKCLFLTLEVLSSAIIYSTEIREPAVGTMRMIESGKDSPILSYIIKCTFIFGGILVSFLTQWYEVSCQLSWIAVRWEGRMILQAVSERSHGFPWVQLLQC